MQTALQRQVPVAVPRERLTPARSGDRVPRPSLTRVEDSMNNVFCRINKAVISGGVGPMAVIDTLDVAGTDLARTAVRL
jgi:hypothetical protein